MIVVKSNIYRKILIFGINLIIPIIFLIYSITTFMNFALLSTELGENLISYRLSMFISIGISISITILFYISRVFPKNSFKRSVYLFVVSLLMVIDGFLWAQFSVIQIKIEDIGSFSVDSTLIFIGLIILLSLNVFLKGFDLYGILSLSYKST